MKICTLVFGFLICSSLVLAQDDEPSVDKSKADAASDTVIVNITRGRQIEGELVNFGDVKVKTSFGESSIPIQEIEGIKFHADEKDACIFAFKNGDLITGQLVVDKITVKTDWGDANINFASVETILINKRGEFYQDATVKGKPRWRFGETTEVPAAGGGTNSTPPRQNQR